MIKYLPLNVFRFNNNPANIVGCATSATSLKKHCLVKQKKEKTFNQFAKFYNFQSSDKKAVSGYLNKLF